MKQTTRYRTGFAMVTAIALITLAAMTITLLGSTIFNQARRTQLTAEDAQLRQLLIAGAAFARNRVQSDSIGQFRVDIPQIQEAGAATLVIEITSQSSKQRTAEIDAGLLRHHLSQQLVFSRRGDTWLLTEALLH